MLENNDFIIHLSISKREKESSYPILYKFKVSDIPIKYRITKVDEKYWFEWTNYDCRYFVNRKIFKSLDKAKMFIFTSEAP